MYIRLLHDAMPGKACNVVQASLTEIGIVVARFTEKKEEKKKTEFCYEKGDSALVCVSFTKVKRPLTWIK